MVQHESKINKQGYWMHDDAVPDILQQSASTLRDGTQIAVNTADCCAPAHRCCWHILHQGLARDVRLRTANLPPWRLFTEHQKTLNYQHARFISCKCNYRRSSYWFLYYFTTNFKLGGCLYGSFFDTVSTSHCIASTLTYLVNDKLAIILKTAAMV